MFKKSLAIIKSAVMVHKNWIIAVVLLISLCLLLIRTGKQLQQKDNLIEQVLDKPDSIKGGLKVKTIEDDVKNFIDIETEDPRIKELQEEVSKYKKELKNKGSVTIAKQQVKLDTSYVKKTDTLTINGSHLDTIDNNHIRTTFGRKNDTVYYSLLINNKQTTVISEEKTGLFKDKKLVVKTTNSNPYFRMEDLVSFQTYNVKPKRFALGFHTGIGTNGLLKPFWVVSVGINYNLIYF